MKHLLNLLLIAASAMTVAAQRPSLLDFHDMQTRLQADEYDELGSISNTLRGLSISPWESSVDTIHYRGYAAVGYLPKFNLGASLGYKLVDTKQGAVSMNAQYDGNKYTRSDETLRNHFADVCAQAYYWVDQNSRIRGELGYGFASVFHPYAWSSPYDDYTQKMSNALASIGWDSEYEKIAFDLSANYRYTSFDGNAPCHVHESEFLWCGTGVNIQFQSLPSEGHPHQSVVSLKGGIGLTQEHASSEVRYRWIGVDFDAQWTNTNETGGNLGEIHLDPYFRLSIGDLKARLGAKFSIPTGDVDTRLKVAPNVRVDYIPEAAQMAVWAEAGGAETLNTYAKMFALDPYYSPALLLGLTNMPISLSAGVNVGPISGLTVALYGRYAAVRNWYAPRIFASYNDMNNVYLYGQPTFDGLDANTWLCGASVDYAYKTYFEVKCSAERAGANKRGNSWYEWMDRAKTQVKASMKVTPISPLDIQLGYDWRGSRRGFLYGGLDYSIGDMRNLWMGASYRICDGLTAWARAENLGNSSYQLISGYEAQGITGLLGLAVKF